MTLGELYLQIERETGSRQLTRGAYFVQCTRMHLFADLFRVARMRMRPTGNECK